ncbi:MAG TPA: hypothetical protein PL166_09475 [Candidatus Contendobacter sp.]|nr:hypothetical protein [Candidatus Contendobacter sp.]HRD49813.1 hypothetical protein [Candidatus Contendobacter sp.]
MNNYRWREGHTARHLWELAELLLDYQGEVYLIMDDSVLDKRDAQVMELVKRQYSGNQHFTLPKVPFSYQSAR